LTIYALSIGAWLYHFIGACCQGKTSLFADFALTLSIREFRFRSPINWFRFLCIHAQI